MMLVGDIEIRMYSYSALNSQENITERSQNSCQQFVLILGQGHWHNALPVLSPPSVSLTFSASHHTISMPYSLIFPLLLTHCYLFLGPPGSFTCISILSIFPLFYVILNIHGKIISQRKSTGGDIRFLKIWKSTMARSWYQAVRSLKKKKKRFWCIKFCSI